MSIRILDPTPHCEKGFACIKKDFHVCCKVIDRVNNDVRFVEPTNNTLCKHRISFGDSFICCCKNRKEIFNQYGW